VIVVLQGCIIVALFLQDCVTVVLQGCVIVVFVFFRVLSHKTDKSEANEPKAKKSCCSKNDLKMI
jgi:hypothetical protein